MTEDTGLVYVGKIINIDPIENADFIVSATVVCGMGGKWRGIVRKDQFEVGSLCIVYMPDAMIPEHDKDMQFMKSSKWRVKMRRFRGAPSEVVIMPYPYEILQLHVGSDMTHIYGIKKYHKPVPANLQGKAKGEFPGFIPKTDEPNYQSADGITCLEKLIGRPYYITEKADGSSTTAFRYKGQFGVCSRNWELEPDESIGYWQIAYKYKLHENLPEGIALQWETCGPKIQSNPMGLKEIQGFAFSAYKIDEHRYLEMTEFWALLDRLGFPSCQVIDVGISFSKDGVELLGEGTYKNGKQREGVVVRSQQNYGVHKPLSFKVINLDYEK
jgi:RNA ligase (TIGR02306 family)